MSPSAIHIAVLQEGQEITETRSIQKLPWTRQMHILYIASGWIMVRNAFRVVEYLQGNNYYLLRHEVYLYNFDGLLMLVVICLFNRVHPAEVTDLYQKRIPENDMCLWYVMDTHNSYMQHEAVRS